jgi:hypothetical protein
VGGQPAAGACRPLRRHETGEQRGLLGDRDRGSGMQRLAVRLDVSEQHTHSCDVDPGAVHEHPPLGRHERPVHVHRPVTARQEPRAAIRHHRDRRLGGEGRQLRKRQRPIAGAADARLADRKSEPLATENDEWHEWAAG